MSQCLCKWPLQVCSRWWRDTALVIIWAVFFPREWLLHSSLLLEIWCTRSTGPFWFPELQGALLDWWLAETLWSFLCLMLPKHTFPVCGMLLARGRWKSPGQILECKRQKSGLCLDRGAESQERVRLIAARWMMQAIKCPFHFLAKTVMHPYVCPLCNKWKDLAAASKCGFLVLFSDVWSFVHSSHT